MAEQRVGDDPFARAKQIRRGELDEEMPDYTELTGWLQRVPMSWLPGLLAATVQLCVIRDVFQDGKMIPYVERAAAKAGDYFRQDGEDVR